MNTEKIIQRIRDLFKTKFFYKKDNLISEINVIKNYPLVQINAALDILIEDQNEFISDRFNRIGHLVNIDEYYLFQPIELDNENISLFDRRNPIDYKHEHIVYPLKDVEEPITLKQPTRKMDSSETQKSKVMSQIKSMITDSLNEIVKVERGQDSWYVYAAMLNHTGYLEKKYNITRDDYYKYIIHHILDYLTFNETEEVLNYLYFAKELDETEQKIKEIYDSQLLKHENLLGIIVPKDNKQFLLMKGDKKWIPGKQEDYIDLKSELKKLIIPVNKYNDTNIVGFIVSFKNEYNIFKIKNLKDSRSKGARCDQSGKAESLTVLNNILGSEQYTSENTKGRNKIEFCILQEFILRKKNLTNDKIWYLTPTQAIVNNIEKMSL